MHILSLTFYCLIVSIILYLFQIETGLKRRNEGYGYWGGRLCDLQVELVDGRSERLVLFVEKIEVVVKCVDLVVFRLVLVFKAKSVFVEQFYLGVYLFVSHHKINNKSRQQPK